MDISSPLERVKGVGEKTSESLGAAGLHTIEDLIYFLPRKYEDFSVITPIDQLKPGKVTLRAKLEDIKTRRVRRGLHITEATLVDETGKTRATWFNQPYRATQIRSGGEFYISGEFELSYQRYQLVNPSVEKVSDVPVQTGRILPIYPGIKGLKSHIVRKILDEVRPIITMLPDTLPESFAKKYEIVSHSKSLLGLHFPSKPKDLEGAKKRFGFEELFALMLAAALNKQENTKVKGWKIKFNERLAKDFVKALPFSLTDAQRRAIWQILQDFEKTTPMNRLLQGDVGSGKTVVAGMAACLAASEDYQTALMAPTEILARQHAETLQNLLKSFDIEVALLIGATPKKAKEELYKRITDGKAQIVVGTHALIQEAVKFHRLGFVVIDEQHRFGVAQRQQLLTKSKHMPHLLSMTATPIPRSLELTVYGELDISVLNEMPKNRKSIKTKIYSPNSRETLYQHIDHEITGGRQAYVVCPLIDESSNSELKSVEAEYKRLKASVFSHRKIGLLHGQLDSKQKDKIMQEFASGKLDILISTTVIEVGVDVPNATVMLIEGADKFGLAQLHQLRGRVGRSSLQSYCYLVPSSSAQPSQRLRALERSNDGFYLAEMDLKLRAGEIYGKAQHGQLNLQVADLADAKSIIQVREAAQWFIKNHINLLKYKRLHSEVARYQRITTLN